jgi:putative oxidoreductase
MATSQVAVSLAAVLLRLGVGATFLVAGLEKVVRGPTFTTDYFASLNIPFPGVVGPLIGWFELVAGLCLLIGIGTTVIAALLAIEMLVAILVARLPEAAQAFSVVDAFVAVRLEVVLALAAASLALLGAGRWSVDALLSARRRRAMASIPTSTHSPFQNGTE